MVDVDIRRTGVGNRAQCSSACLNPARGSGSDPSTGAGKHAHKWLGVISGAGQHVLYFIHEESMGKHIHEEYLSI